MRAQPLITVADVAVSSRWYQNVLGLTSGHGGPEYEQLLKSTGEMVLQLHHWDAHDHALLGDEKLPVRGNGSILWFQTDDFAGLVERVRSEAATVLNGPLNDPLAQHQEVWLHDPDGYVVVVASQYGNISARSESDSD
jgi:catechol 2,3-dioxygenase-like lactoylglutathione lyase family enzyme